MRYAWKERSTFGNKMRKKLHSQDCKCPAIDESLVTYSECDEQAADVNVPCKSKKVSQSGKTAQRCRKKIKKKIEKGSGIFTSGNLSLRKYKRHNSAVRNNNMPRIRT